MVTDANPRAKDWKAAVASTAASAIHGPLDGPLEVRFDFYFLRPANHFRSGKNSAVVRDSAPGLPIVRPDVLKLSRSTEDALTGVAWRDDAQIVVETLTKQYGDTVGASITIRQLTWDSTMSYNRVLDSSYSNL